MCTKENSLLMYQEIEGLDRTLLVQYEQDEKKWPINSADMPHHTHMTKKEECYTVFKIQKKNPAWKKI